MVEMKRTASPEEKRQFAAYMKRYTAEHPDYHESTIQRSRKFWHDNHDEVLKKQKEYHAKHRKQRNDAGKRNHHKIRQMVFDHYGQKCAWPGCDVTDPDMLQIDHVNGDGCRHRKEIGDGGGNISRYLVKNNFPEGFRILCANHNWKHRANLEREKVAI
jgi:hypothetical protein